MEYTWVLASWSVWGWLEYCTVRLAIATPVFADASLSHGNLSARAYTTDEHLVSQWNDTAAQKECKNDVQFSSTRRYSSQYHTVQEASTQVYPTRMAPPRTVLFRREVTPAATHVERLAVGKLSMVKCTRLIIMRAGAWHVRDYYGSVSWSCLCARLLPKACERRVLRSSATSHICIKRYQAHCGRDISRQRRRLVAFQRLRPVQIVGSLCTEVVQAKRESSERTRVQSSADKCGKVCPHLCRMKVKVVPGKLPKLLLVTAGFDLRNSTFVGTAGVLLTPCKATGENPTATMANTHQHKELYSKWLQLTLQSYL